MLLTAIITFLLLALLGGGIVFFRQDQKKKQVEARLRSLESALAAANTRMITQTESVKTIHMSSTFEKAAGLVVSQMDRGVVIIDENRVVRLINDYAKQFLDLAAGPGMSYKEVIHIHATGKTDNWDMFEAAFSGKVQHLSDTMELVSQRGEFPVGGTIMPLMSGPSVTSIVFMFEDNRKQVARVKEEHAFFSAAAHELRTPLTVIRMTVSLLKEKFESLPKEKIIEHLRRTDETTEKLVTLVNEFLNISRLDQGRLEVKTEKFDMVTLTDEVIGNLALLAKQRNLYVHHEIQGSERMVVADRAKAAEVLSNLIGNGLKYTIQGGLTITHTVTGSALTTTVTDTGPGIPHDAQSLLFKRFGQIGSQPKQPAKSTGLGLYISKQFALLMRGDVILEKSEPGTGSTFAFMLPLG